MRIKTKYASTCKRCGVKFQIGEEVEWLGQGQGATHIDCQPQQTELVEKKPVLSPPRFATREGRMLSQGRLHVTLTDKATGKHATLYFRTMIRDDESARPWKQVPWDDATWLFVSVGKRFSERIAVGYPQSGDWKVKDPSREDRAELALAFLQYLAKPLASTLPQEYKIETEDACGRCGRSLNDPVSIERGVGPDCYGKMTKSQHVAWGEAYPDANLLEKV